MGALPINYDIRCLNFIIFTNFAGAEEGLVDRELRMTKILDGYFVSC